MENHSRKGTCYKNLGRKRENSHIHIVLTRYYLLKLICPWLPEFTVIRDLEPTGGKFYYYSPLLFTIAD